MSPTLIIKPDSFPNTSPGPSQHASCGLGQGTPVPAQTSLLNEALDLMRSLVIIEELLPNCTQPELGAGNRELYFPPTTHFIATVEDLTDMLDYTSEDIDGMDDDVGEEEARNPPFTGRWTATSSYDVYMVDAPKENSGDDKEDLVEDKPPEIQPKRRRQR